MRCARERWELRDAFVVAILVAGVASCGGGDGGTTGPVDPTMNGTWQGTVTNVTGSGVTCAMSGLAMTLAQTDTTFAGSYTIAHLSCSGPGGNSGGGPFAGTIANGTIVNDDVTFDLDGPELHFTGTKIGNRLQGSTVWTLDLGPPTGVVILTGSWSVNR